MLQAAGVATVEAAAGSMRGLRLLNFFLPKSMFGVDAGIILSLGSAAKKKLRHTRKQVLIAKIKHGDKESTQK